MKDALATAFNDASQFLVEAVGLVREEDWGSPGLGTWDLRELVGHANRSHTLIEEYILRPQQPEPPGSAYFSDEAVAARGKQAVAALGKDPLPAVRAASAAAILLVEATEADAIVGSPAGTMTLYKYLPSRIAELTVHGLDITRAVGSELSPPVSALTESLVFVARRSVRKDGAAVLLALSGRGPLPVGYSAY